MILQVINSFKCFNFTLIYTNLFTEGERIYVTDVSYLDDEMLGDKFSDYHRFSGIYSVSTKCGDYLFSQSNWLNDVKIVSW